jgi:hypothetical protein
MGSWGKTLALTLVALFLIVIVYSAVPVVSAPIWNVQTVDVNGAGGGLGHGKGCPITVDSNNLPHIAYTDISISYISEGHWNDVDSVMYSSWNGSTWNAQKIAEGDALSLILDANSTPHILYSGQGDLIYSSWTGTNWTSQIVDTNQDWLGGAVALDAFGNPHVAYTNGTIIKYAIWTGLNWTIQTVDNYDYITNQNQLSLVIDSNNVPIIFYDRAIQFQANGSSYEYENLRLATLQNSNWNIQNIANASSYGNMVLDSKGHLHLIYNINYPQFTGYGNNTLVYASSNGTAWNTQNVISTDITTCFLALDSYDYPHISYISSNLTYISWTLTYTSWTGRTWDTQIVDSNKPPTHSCYLALDSNGNPHISYLGVPQKGDGYNLEANILYATTNETTPIFTPSPSPTATPANIFLNVSMIVPFVAVAILAVAIVSLLFYIKHRKTASKLKV